MIREILEQNGVFDTFRIVTELYYKQEDGYTNDRIYVVSFKPLNEKFPGTFATGYGCDYDEALNQACIDFIYEKGFNLEWLELELSYLYRTCREYYTINKKEYTTKILLEDIICNSNGFSVLELNDKDLTAWLYANGIEIKE